MRKVLGSNLSVSIADSTYLAQQKTSTGSWLFLCPSCWRARSARVAELALQRLCKRKVMGSIPRVAVHISWSCSRYMLAVKRFPGGTWCSGITSAPHAEGPGLEPHRPLPLGCASCLGDEQQVFTYARTSLAAGSDHGAHGVVVSHPLRMRKALGSNPSVSISAAVPQLRLWQLVTCMGNEQEVCAYADQYLAASSKHRCT